MALHYIIAFLIFLRLTVSYIRSNTRKYNTKDQELITEDSESEITIKNKLQNEDIDTPLMRDENPTANYLSILSTILST